MTNDDFQSLLETRFGASAPAPCDAIGEAIPEVWRSLAGRASVRRFADRSVPAALIETLAAVALSTPSKSDLQQRDIVYVQDPVLRQSLLTLVSDQAWTAHVPELLVFCGNNARQRELHARTGHPFANDHLDAFFNASVDAGIALSAFIVAAEAAGLGCCPISAIRNRPRDVSALLDLPAHVFPVAGLALGWPSKKDDAVTPRLPLCVTFHRDRYDATAFDAHIAAYDAVRHGMRPGATQRNPERFGTAEIYGWSEDKARQYAASERADFGAYIREQGFLLD